MSALLDEGTAVNGAPHLREPHPKVRAAQVSTEKPDVYPDCESVGCEVFGLKAPA